MKMIEEIRRENLKALIEEAGGLAQLAQRLERSDSQVSQWAQGSIHSATGERRGMRPSTARYIEEKAGRPKGWLDADHSKNTEKKGGDHSNNSDGIAIPQYKTGGGMGNGHLLLDDQPGVIKSWHVDTEWLRLNVRHHTGSKNLCIVTGFGPSMRPMFNPGDPLLVDIGVKECVNDSVYFFRVGREGYIKMLQRIPTEKGLVIRAKSKNSDYESFDITEGMDFEVLGKVLTVWKSEQF